ncbi:hypothetical protein EAH_00065160, partial [Eimeria acervulina]
TPEGPLSWEYSPAVEVKADEHKVKEEEEEKNNQDETKAEKLTETLLETPLEIPSVETSLPAALPVANKEEEGAETNKEKEKKIEAPKPRKHVAFSLPEKEEKTEEALDTAEEEDLVLQKARKAAKKHFKTEEQRNLYITMVNAVRLQYQILQEQQNSQSISISQPQQQTVRLYLKRITKF